MQGGSLSRSTFCGVAHSFVKTSDGTSPAIGRKLKMPPPALLMRTTVRDGRAYLQGAGNSGKIRKAVC